jgi:ribosomal protein S18 acetylase RimI-like enzyme
MVCGMDVISLGYQTDLALLRLGGSTVEDRGDHLVIRTPDNPTYWWGNFLLIAGPPPLDQTGAWVDRFHAEFPAARHVALGFDGVRGTLDDLAGFTDAGLSCEGQTVMTASAVHEPPHPNGEATYRELSSDDDWAQHVEMRVVTRDEQHEDEATYRVFAEAKSATWRCLTEAGHGAWFGAFVDGGLLSTMGLFRAGDRLARFQSVETHPDARGRGLAGTLVHHVSQYGFGELGAKTLVMVADPTYLAIRIYRSVGFEDTETQLQAERPPTDESS